MMLATSKNKKIEALATAKHILLRNFQMEEFSANLHFVEGFLMKFQFVKLLKISKIGNLLDNDGQY